MKLDITASAKVDFILILSADVIIDLLCFGSRRQLAALESIGRRFHVLIDVGLSSAPFICFQHLACPIEIPIECFKKMDEQNKLHDVEDGKVRFLLRYDGNHNILQVADITITTFSNRN